MQLIVNLLLSILGLLSLIFGIVGVGVMTVFWRIAHVIIGILMLWGALPYVLDVLLPPKR